MAKSTALNKEPKGDFLRDLPKSIEAEQALLGAILSNNKSIEKVSEFLRQEHFAEITHAKIYAACQKLIERGHLADPITLKDYFETEGTLSDIGGLDYLTKLAASSSSVINTEDYGKLVYDRAIRRSLIEVGEDIVNGAFKDDLETTSEKQIELAEQKLYDLATEGYIADGLSSFGDALKDALIRAEYAYKSDGSIAGVSTALKDLDKKIGGLNPSDLLIIAGRPGMGKSDLAINIAFNVANEVANKRAPDKLNGPVALFSLEMSSDQLATRILANTAEVPGHKIRTGSISTDEFHKIAEFSRALDKLPLYIDDTPGISVSAIRTRARRLKRIHGGLSLIIIDYIQLLSPTAGKKSENRVQELSEITRALKILAKELDVPVIALSQLSRQVEQREDKRPLLSDLRESGSIEQDADIVMFIYREAYYHERKEPEDPNSEKYHDWQIKLERIKNKSEVIVAKQRHGPTGTIPLFYRGEFSKFGDFYDG